MNAALANDFLVPHTLCLARSFKRLTGRGLLAGNFSAVELAEKIWEAPFVVVSHGTQADPVLNYGNRTALALWEMSWDEFTRTPSRLTVRSLTPLCVAHHLAEVPARPDYHQRSIWM